MWKFADVLRAAGLAGGGVFLVLGWNALAGLCIGAAGVIAFGDIKRNSPEMIRDGLEALQGKR